MKTKFSFLIIITFVISSSCKKTDRFSPDDNSPPKIHLNGDNPMIITLNDVYIDPGASATDNIDGTRNLSSEIVMTHNIPLNGPSNGLGITNTTGTYTVTYRVSDNAGNTTTNTRTVIVRNNAFKYAIQYLFDKTGSEIFPNFTDMPTVIDYDENINNRIYFNNISNQNGFIVVADIIGDTAIHIPDQGIILNNAGVENLYRISSNNGQSFITNSIILTLTIEYNLEKYEEADIADYDYFFMNRYWKASAFGINTEFYEQL